MTNFGRNLALWVIIALLLVVLFNLFQPGTQSAASKPIAYSDFIEEVNNSRVQNVVIQGRTITGQTSEGQSFTTYMPPDDAGLVTRLTEKKIRFQAKPD